MFFSIGCITNTTFPFFCHDNNEGKNTTMKSQNVIKTTKIIEGPLERHNKCNVSDCWASTDTLPHADSADLKTECDGPVMGGGY
jgi:hypothetical protein